MDHTKRLSTCVIAVMLAVTFLMFTQCTSVEGNNTQESSMNAEGSRRVGVLTQDTGALRAIIDLKAEIEVLGEGFTWSEGPLWIASHQMLLFTDVPENKVFVWTDSGGVKEYLSPSGFTGTTTTSREPGANGLALSPSSQLLLCQHGDRRVARMEAPLHDPKPVFVTVADSWEGKRFNSPNDLIVNSRNQIFFTDPPYGLEKHADDPGRQIDFMGVYRRDPDGSVHAIIRDLTRPNGLALSPDEKTLYVANSDPDRAIWMAYALDEMGNPDAGKVFYDATSLVGTHKGLPDGLKVNRNGIIFATGPGGVWIFDPAGNALGRIDTGEAMANCAFNEDQSVLFMCADAYLMRVKLNS